jgi:hypothetical protein
LLLLRRHLLQVLPRAGASERSRLGGARRAQGRGAVQGAVPVVSDMVFELVRSRGLAIVEATAFFLLAVAVPLPPSPLPTSSAPAEWWHTLLTRVLRSGGFPSAAVPEVRVPRAQI